MGKRTDPTGTIADLARIIGISSRAVSEMQAHGVLKRYPPGAVDLYEAAAAYCAHLRKSAAGRGEAGLATQRARLAQAQAERTEAENAVRKRELLPAEEVNLAVTSAFARVRARLLALPSRAAAEVVALATIAEVAAKLTTLVHEALAELGGTQVVALLGADAAPTVDRQAPAPARRPKPKQEEETR